MKAKLGEVCLVRRGTTITQEKAIKGDIPVVAGGLNPTYYHNKANRFNPTITISGSGANAGYVNFWKHAIFASDCSTVETKDTNLDINFVYFFLLSNQDYIYRKLRSGAAQPHVYAKDIAEIIIPIPPLSIQKKIVTKVDTILAEIKRSSEVSEFNIENANALFQTYLNQIFSKKSNLRKIGEILKLEYGKALGESDRDISGLYAAYGANGIKSKTNKYLYDKPSIIVGRKGSAGELTLVNDKFWALDVAYFVTHNEKNTDLHYLFYALLEKKLPLLAKGVKPGINRNEVYNLDIDVPNITEQKKIVERLANIKSALDNTIILYTKKINELSSLRQSILNKVFIRDLVEELI